MASPTFRAISEVLGATAANITVPRPTTVDGDLLLAFIGKDDNIAPTAPAGWTLLTSALPAANSSLWVFWKYSSGEPANWIWTFASVWREALCVSYSGVPLNEVPFDPIVPAAPTTSASATTLNCNANITSTAETRVLLIGHNFSGGVWTTNGSYTLRGTSGGDPNGMIIVADRELAAAGSAAAASHTQGSAGPMASYMIVLRSVSGIRLARRTRSSGQRRWWSGPFSWSLADRFSIARYFLRQPAAGGPAATNLAPDPVAATTSIAAPTITLALTLTPTPVVATTSIAAPTVGLVSTLTPTPVAAVTSIAAPTIGHALTISPNSVVAVTSIASPTLALTYTLSPNPTVAVTSIAEPTLDFTGTTNLTPDPVSATTSIAAPSVTHTYTLSPNPTVAVTSIADPTVEVTGGTTNLAPTPVAAVTSIATPSVTGTIGGGGAAAGPKLIYLLESGRWALRLSARVYLEL